METQRNEIERAHRLSRAPRIPDNRLWTVHDVSYYLGVPVATLYQWRCANRGPASRRVGRYIRYRPSDVFAWLDDATTAGYDS